MEPGYHDVGLVEEGNVQHDVLVPPEGALGHLPAHEAVDLRVRDGVELGTQLVVAEDDVAERLTVDLVRAVLEEENVRDGSVLKNYEDSSIPTCLNTASPKAALIFLQALDPGATTFLARTSASMMGTP